MISGQKQLRRLTHYESGCSPQQPSGNRASQLSKGMRFRSHWSIVLVAKRLDLFNTPEYLRFLLKAHLRAAANL